MFLFVFIKGKKRIHSLQQDEVPVLLLIIIGCGESGKTIFNETISSTM